MSCFDVESAMPVCLRMSWRTCSKSLGVYSYSRTLFGAIVAVLMFAFTRSGGDRARTRARTARGGRGLAGGGRGADMRRLRPRVDLEHGHRLGQVGRLFLQRLGGSGGLFD